MKKSLLFLALFVSIVGYSQTATNFICDDCKGENVNLFNKLDSGKVIVICWVMPCSTCIPASKTTYNVVESYQSTYPNRVYFYLADDYANSSCNTLNSWGNSNNILTNTFSLRFSNALVSMTNYGSTGMPKIIVLGGSSHNVFYNENSTVDPTALSTAINSALAAPSKIEEADESSLGFNLYPNPANNSLNLSFTSQNTSAISVDIYNDFGQNVYTKTTGFIVGQNNVELSTKDFANGIYFVRIGDSVNSKMLKFNVLH
jgi:hypothetical protein